LIGYFLVKVTPKWGLILISTCVIYLAPLIYVTNKELIDSHLSNAAQIANKQTEQLREVAAKNTNKAMEATSQATSQYVSLAQEYIGGAKKTAVDKGYVSKDTAAKLPGAPVEKSYTSSPAQDTTSSAAPTEQSSAPITSNEKPVSSHSGPDFPVAPIENVSSSIQPTPIVGSTDFPAAPKNEPQVPSANEAPALSTEVHGIEEKKEPLHAI
jgi:hypothetical protein